MRVGLVPNWGLPVSPRLAPAIVLAHNPEEHCKGKNPPLARTLRSQAGRFRKAPQAASLDYRLTTAKRKEILLNSLYGVDIDPQAIEVTKLSLLLKVLEGESDESINAQLKMFHERALPDLGKNIKCGNSLIAPDFHENEQMSLANEDERIRINVFDWKTEFPDIIGGGGFDAVIGNPPYIFTRELLTGAQRAYFATRYLASWEKHNTYMLFMEAMLRLLAPHGYGGFIVPNSWLTIESAKLLRDLYIPRISVLMDLNYAAFQRVAMEPCIFVISGKSDAGPAAVARIASQNDFGKVALRPFDRNRWTQAGGRLVFSTDGSSEAALLLVDQLVTQSSTVGDNFEVLTGLQAYEKGKGDPPQTAAMVRDHVFDRTRKQDKQTYPYLDGRDVGRYNLNWSGSWLRYGPWLSQPRELSMFTRPRVLLREITGRFPHCLHATCVEETYLNNKSILNVLDHANDVSKLHLLTGVLNSRLITLFYKERAVKSARKFFPKVVIKNLREFPFPRKVDEQVAGRIKGLVERTLDLHRELATAKSPHDRERIPREIEPLDTQINYLVYELFGLSADQISIVEAATP
jgi:Eco57I restriction-modification methylase/restriction endonuclease TaqI-like protein